MLLHSFECWLGRELSLWADTHVIKSETFDGLNFDTYLTLNTIVTGIGPRYRTVLP